MFILFQNGGMLKSESFTFKVNTENTEINDEIKY